MQLSKKIFFFLLFIFQVTISFAQQKNNVENEQYRAIHWTRAEDGLPNDGTNAFFKDPKGFLWIGSVAGGLCRFDGTNFKGYHPDQQKSGTINSEAIYSFEEDSLHNIWMGTGAGLSRYDIAADTFTNFLPLIDSAFPQSNITPFTIAPFWATKDEMYCIEPSGTITAINIHTLKREKILQLSTTNRPAIVWNTNKSFFDKSSKSFWFLCGGGRLEQVYPDGRVQFYTWPYYEGKTGNDHRRHDAEDMCYDPGRNSVWINSGEGLLEFSLTTKQFRNIEALSELTKQKSYDRGVGVDIDRQGRIWFSTSDQGIFIYDPQTEQIKPVFPDHGMQLKTGAANLHIYCDRDGIVWTSDWASQGMYELLPFNPVVKRYVANPSAKNALSNGLISTIVPGPQGKLWLGTADGLNIFDPVTETFEVLREKDLPGIKGTAIIPLYIDTIGQKAWLNAGSQQTDQQYFGMGMYEMDIKTRKCSPIVFMDGSKRIDTFRVLHGMTRPYKNGIIFCDELHGVWEIKKGSLVANLLIPIAPGPAGFGNILLVEDHYLFLDHGSALSNYAFENKNGKWTRAPNVLDNIGWFSALYNKKDQTYWVSGNELVHYNKEFGVIKAYTQEDGYNAPMLTMQLDNYGNLWFANTSQQIGKLNTASGIFSTISDTDGYQKMGSFWMVPITKDVRGDLYFGIGAHIGTGDLSWGLDRVYPERFSAATSVVYLNALFINQKPFSLNAQINELDELSLKHDQNTISIEAGIIDYYSKTKGKIRYRLGQDGKEGDWQYPPDHIIRYESLSPGSYRLVVQSSNIKNEFNSPEKILLINISPAFWNTWWFRTAAAIFILTVFYGIIRYRTQQKFKMRLERLEKEKQITEKEKQVAELQQQKTEIEMQALRAQMNPHFIFNSLNSINRFILQNNKAEASEYLTKFSKLVRMILQNSQASLVTLESELESLGLYLEMEALRFNYYFTYKISVQKDLDIEVLKVPPLIIQPYVENAIWHGLMHKEEKGELNIEISAKDDHLYLKITDNGIGRKQAAALASKSATKHKSMGLRITEQRIEMLQSANGKGAPVSIVDLAYPDGSAAGTEVTIKIPEIYD
jgi:streptogramin lyase